MDFIEHDLKTLTDHMNKPFLQSEVKTLLLQLISATHEMHSKWIMHRDLKTSNLLMTNRGMIKIADFGLATTFGDFAADLTRTVVTLWYRYVSPSILKLTCFNQVYKERQKFYSRPKNTILL